MFTNSLQGMSDEIIRIDEDFKEKLDNYEGSNYTQRIKNYCKEKEEQVDTLDFDDLQLAVKSVLEEASIDSRTGKIEFN